MGFEERCNRGVTSVVAYVIGGGERILLARVVEEFVVQCRFRLLVMVSFVRGSLYGRIEIVTGVVMFENWDL